MRAAAGMLWLAFLGAPRGPMQSETVGARAPGGYAETRALRSGIVDRVCETPADAGHTLGKDITDIGALE